MEEQSHKDEMRAALQGDFERMRQRQAGEGESAGASVSSALTHAEPTSPVDEPSGSWLDRLLGRI